MLGKRIADLRKEHKLSQYELANRIGFSRGKLANYEQGSRQPDYETLIRIADFFDVSTDFLLGKTDLQNKRNFDISLSDEEKKIFDELKKYPVLFHDLSSNPEKKIKELIKLQKAKKLLFEDDDDEEMGEGFGELED